MHNLEYLLLHDSTLSNTWIFDPGEIKFQLREVKLRFTWDERILDFLQSQRKLRLLTIFDILADLNRPELKPGSLPLLNTFDGTIMMAMQLLSCPLTHLQMRITGDSKRHLPLLLSKLSHVHKTLRSLSLMQLHDGQAVEALATISAVCPTLQHIGLIPLPIDNVSARQFLFPCLNSKSCSDMNSITTCCTCTTCVQSKSIWYIGFLSLSLRPNAPLLLRLRCTARVSTVWCSGFTARGSAGTSFKMNGIIIWTRNSTRQLTRRGALSDVSCKITCI
jgi:hypothetical protein